METIEKEEIRIKKDQIISRIRKGDIFIHPTDTIYGIGCNALKTESVLRVRGIKERIQSKPFSVIAPSKSWILENCEIDDEAQGWIDKLPGPYTLILRLKDDSVFHEAVNAGKRTIGVRIPDHWMAELINEAGVPVVTASANRRGENYMTSMDDIDPKVHSKVDFVIYNGEKQGKPSTLVNLAGEDIDSSKEREII